MYRSFKALSVTDERELRSPERMRSMNRVRNSGTWAAVLLLGIGGLASLAFGIAGLYIRFKVPPAPPETGWTIAAIGGFFGLMMTGMALAFYRELYLSPLAGYLRGPQRYEFVRGMLEEAHYISDGKRSGSRMVVKGACVDGGLFFEEFEPGLWSGAVAERGEEHGLKPGDDRYGQKGRRVRMPIEVWVVREIGSKRAALAGIPAETVARLEKKDLDGV